MTICTRSLFALLVATSVVHAQDIQSPGLRGRLAGEEATEVDSADEAPPGMPGRRQWTPYGGDYPSLWIPEDWEKPDAVKGPADWDHEAAWTEVVDGKTVPTSDGMDALYYYGWKADSLLAQITNAQLNKDSWLQTFNQKQWQEEIDGLLEELTDLRLEYDEQFEGVFDRGLKDAAIFYGEQQNRSVHGLQPAWNPVEEAVAIAFGLTALRVAGGVAQSAGRSAAREGLDHVDDVGRVAGDALRGNAGKQAVKPAKDVSDYLPKSTESGRELLDEAADLGRRKKRGGKHLSRRRAKKRKGTLSFPKKPLDHTFGKHAADFGTFGTDQAAKNKFIQAIQEFVDDGNIRVIKGTYDGKPTIFYVDPVSRLHVFTDLDGALKGAWRLNPRQYKRLLKHKAGGNANRGKIAEEYMKSLKTGN